jgi:SHS family lactate transporter-like MFS transporter
MRFPGNPQQKIAAATEPGTNTAGSQIRDRHAAFLVGFAGWTLDAFDFFLVVFCLTDIGREFQKSDVTIALAITVTLILRPVGALVFGLLADRYGRRIPLMANLVLSAAVQLFTGLAPTFISFLILRALFGMVMGGQWGVGASLAMEKVPRAKRGLYSGILQEGYAVGNLLAAVAYFAFFNRWGWRPLFFLGSVPALLAALIVYFKVNESEVWHQTKASSWGSLSKILASNWKLFLYMTIFMMAMNMASHGTQDMYPTLLKRQWSFSAHKVAAITGISMLGAILGGTLFGLISDRLGRRRSILLAFGGALLTIPFWAFPANVAALIGGAFVMQFMVQGAWGVIPAHLAELSPDSIRGFLPGFGYQCGVLLASATVVLQAVFAREMTYSMAMAATAAVVFSLAILMTAVGKERHATHFGRSG